MLREDIRAVFMNPAGFGEPHKLDGVEYTMVVDDDQLEQWKGVNLANSIKLPEHALANVRVYIFIALEDYPRPAENQIINYDGLPLRVVSTMAADGMLEMVLGGITEYGGR
jgi:hypothetical protein